MSDILELYLNGLNGRKITDTNELLECIDMEFLNGNLNIIKRYKTCPNYNENLEMKVFISRFSERGKILSDYELSEMWSLSVKDIQNCIYTILYIIVKDLNVLLAYYKVNHKRIRTTDEWHEVDVSLNELFKQVN